MRTRVAFVLFSVTSFVVACSGSSPGDLFSADEPRTTDGGPTGSGTTNNPTTDSGIVTGNAAPSTDGSTTPDTSRPDASSTGAVFCGPTLACPIGDTCCATVTETPARYTCKTGRVECPEPAVDIQCDSAEDCTGLGSSTICCGDREIENGRTLYRALSCRSSCNGGDVTFCNPGNPAASCGTTRRCAPSAILVGYSTCQ